MIAAETKQLSKSFGKTKALDDVSVKLARGSVVGLIGLNGSGKTTLLHHFTGLQIPSSGECFTFGVPAHKLNADQLGKIGCVFQNQRLLEWMSVDTHLQYISRFYAHWDTELAERLLRDFDLDPKAHVGSLSPGNLQKLAVICATCHRPEFLILDEPASAMDPIARKSFLVLLFELLEQEEQTVVISSHTLTEIERIVDHIICLDRGKLREDLPFDSLQEQFSEWRLSGNTPLELTKEPCVLN